MDHEEILKDLNSLPQKSTEVVNYVWEKVKSTGIFPITDQSPITFEIPGRSDAFIDVKNIQQILTFRIRKRQDNAIVNLTAGDGARIVPYNYFLHTCMSEVQLDIQHQALFKQYNYADILSYIKALYSEPNDVKNSILQNALWYQDEGGGHSMVQGNIDDAPGEYRRNRLILNSQTVQLQGNIPIDPLQVARPYPENVSISLRFFPNTPNKCIVQNVAAGGIGIDLVLEILDMTLLVPRIYPKQSLLKQPVSLPYISNEIIRVMIPPRQVNFGPRTIKIADILPRRGYVFLWTEAQLNGSYTENRLALNHLGVKKCLLQCNDRHLPYWDGWTMNFTDNHYNELYYGLFKQLGLDPSTVSVDKRSFPNGFVIFPFEITGKDLSSDYYSGKQSGSLELTLEFREPTETNIAIMIVLENEKVLSFNRNREFKDTYV